MKYKIINTIIYILFISKYFYNFISSIKNKEIDKELLSILEEYLEDNNISNKSKYIENLIREDFKKKGKNIDRKF